MKNKGITLITLVITIIVLMVLAGVTVATLTGENGIIAKAQEAREKSEIAKIEEQLGLAKMSAKLRKQGGTITIDNLLEELEKQGVDTEKEDDKTIVINGKYVYELEEKDKDVEWVNQGTITAPKPKIVSLEIVEETNTTIKIAVTVTRNGKGKLIYSIKENGEYIEADTIQTSGDDLLQEEYIFIIDPYKTYTDIKVEAIAENGEKASKEIEIKPSNVPTLTDSKITFSYHVKGEEIRETDWTQGPITVTMRTSTDVKKYTLQYTTGDPKVESNWKEYNTGIEFIDNGKLYVRLWDGTEAGRYRTERIENIDRLEPNQFTPTATSGVDSITLTGFATDQEGTETDGCSGIDKYYFSKDNGAIWVPTEGQLETSYTFKGLDAEHSYQLKMKAVDKAGNKIETETVEEQTSNCEIKFSYSTQEMTKENVIVTIETNVGTEDGYKIEYSKDGTNWNEYLAEGISMEENGEIHVRVIKKSNGKVLGQGTANVENIDKTAPNRASITIDKTNGVTAEVTQSDNQNGSGVDIANCKWIITMSDAEIGTDETKYTGGNFTTNPQTIPVNCEGKNIYYLHVLTVDKLGNKKETISDMISLPGISVWTGKVNSPNLSEDMTAIYWDETNEERMLTEENTEQEWEKWYDYIEGDNATDTKTSKWANAKMTKDGVDSYFVWIPRYEYKISSGEGTSTAGKIEVKFIPTTKITPDVGYKIHPAFQNGTSNHFQNGEWDCELPGIWVGKYQTSQGANTTVQIKPGIQSWANISVEGCYTTSYNYDRAKESHLMKNSEWGAVAYLTHSQYGRNGNEIGANNSTSYVTATGGEVASTTGNKYGIYDLSGAAWEYVAGYISNGTSSIGAYLNLIPDLVAEKEPDAYKTKSNKYLTIYPFNASGESSENNYAVYKNAKNSNYGYGDAILETSTSGNGTATWFNDTVIYPFNDFAWFLRGAECNGGFNLGIFSIGDYTGRNTHNISFRVVLAGE